MCHFFLVCPSVISYLGWFYDSATVNTIAITMICKYLCDKLISSGLGKLARSGRAGSCDRWNFSLLRNLLVDFRSGWTGVQSQEQCMRFHFHAHPPAPALACLMMLILG